MGAVGNGDNSVYHSRVSDIDRKGQDGKGSRSRREGSKDCLDDWDTEARNSPPPSFFDALDAPLILCLENKEEGVGDRTGRAAVGSFILCIFVRSEAHKYSK